MHYMDPTEARKFMKSQTRPIYCYNTWCRMFWSLFIFCGHSAPEPASISHDNKQDYLLYPAGLHGNCINQNNCSFKIGRGVGIKEGESPTGPAMKKLGQGRNSRQWTKPARSTPGFTAEQLPGHTPTEEVRGYLCAGVRRLLLDLCYHSLSLLLQFLGMTLFCLGQFCTVADIVTSPHQHTSASTAPHQHTSACTDLHQHTSACTAPHNIPVLVQIYTNIPVLVQIYTNIPVLVQIYTNIPVLVQIYTNIPVLVQIYTNIPVLVQLYTNILVLVQLSPQVVYKIPVLACTSIYMIPAFVQLSLQVVQHETSACTAVSTGCTLTAVSAGCTPRYCACTAVSAGCTPRYSASTAVSAGCTPRYCACTAVSASCTLRYSASTAVSAGCTPKYSASTAVSAGCTPRYSACTAVSAGCTPRYCACTAVCRLYTKVLCLYSCLQAVHQGTVPVQLSAGCTPRYCACTAVSAGCT